jgi:hypothetical protein
MGSLDWMNALRGNAPHISREADRSQAEYHRQQA